MEQNVLTKARDNGKEKTKNVNVKLISERWTYYISHYVSGVCLSLIADRGTQ